LYFWGSFGSRNILSNDAVQSSKAKNLYKTRPLEHNNLSKRCNLILVTYLKSSVHSTWKSLTILGWSNRFRASSSLLFVALTSSTLLTATSRSLNVPWNTEPYSHLLLIELSYCIGFPIFHIVVFRTVSA
jgi:hypothetical protein